MAGMLLLFSVLKIVVLKVQMNRGNAKFLNAIYKQISARCEF